MTAKNSVNDISLPQIPEFIILTNFVKVPFVCKGE